MVHVNFCDGIKVHDLSGPSPACTLFVRNAGSPILAILPTATAHSPQSTVHGTYLCRIFLESPLSSPYDMNLLSRHQSTRTTDSLHMFCVDTLPYYHIRALEPTFISAVSIVRQKCHSTPENCTSSLFTPAYLSHN